MCPNACDSCARDQRYRASNNEYYYQRPVMFLNLSVRQFPALCLSKGLEVVALWLPYPWDSPESRITYGEEDCAWRARFEDQGVRLEGRIEDEEMGLDVHDYALVKCTVRF